MTPADRRYLFFPHRSVGRVRVASAYPTKGLKDWCDAQHMVEVDAPYVRVEVTSAEDLSFLATVGQLDGLMVLPFIEDPSPLIGFLDSQVRLKELFVQGPGVDDTALQAIGRVPTLDHLMLTGIHATPGGYASLAGLPLTFLLLNCSTEPEWMLDDEGLAALVDALPNLQDLTVYGEGVSDAALAAVVGLTRLVDLTFVNARGITGAGLPTLAGAKRLSSLALRGCGLSDRSLHQMPVLPDLELLDLSDNDIGAEALIGLRRLPSLRFLRAEDTRISTEDLVAFNESLATRPEKRWRIERGVAYANERYPRAN